jgi:hypothetical protein
MTSTGFPEKGRQVKRKADGLTGEVCESDPSRDVVAVHLSARGAHKIIVCSSEEFVRDWDVTVGTAPKRINYKQAIIASVILGICFFIWLKSCVGGFTYPSDVLDHKISVVNGSTEFDVTIKLEGWNAGSVYHVAGEIPDVVKHELEEGSQEQSILFRIVGDVHSGGGNDDYGNPMPESSTTFNAFNIRYSMDDMKKVNWDYMSGIGLLNLGSVTRFGSYGDNAVQSYCEKSLAQTYSHDFCANF